jgi:uncharacterized protein
MTFNPDPRHWHPQHLDVGVTDHCGLDCRYCYNKLGRGAARGRMGREVCDQVLEYTRRLAMYWEPHTGQLPINWNLFGGEPMEAFEVIEYLVTQAERRKLPVNVEVFTNGSVGTEEQIQWCRKHNVKPKRSVGGCPEMCAVTRPGDYLDKYEARSPLWDDWGVMRRVTLVPGTEHLVMSTLRYFYDKGYWGGIDFVTDDYADWSDEQIATLKSQLTKLAEEFVRQFHAGHVLFNERIQVMAQWLFQQPRQLNVACGAGWGTQAITWDGYIQPCHRFLREPRDSAFSGGTLSDILAGKAPAFGPLFVDAILSASRFEETDECKACVARYSCQHGCYHLSWVACGGDMKKTPRIRCEIYRHYIKLAKWIHGELAPVDPIWYLCVAEPCEPIPDEEMIRNV